MNQKLKELFEYQRFEKNAKLAALISETENRYKKELDDEDLFYVNAAQGMIDALQYHPEKNNPFGETGLPDQEQR